MIMLRRDPARGVREGGAKEGGGRKRGGGVKKGEDKRRRGGRLGPRGCGIVAFYRFLKGERGGGN